MTPLVVTLLGAAMLLTAMLLALVDATRQAAALRWTGRDDRSLARLLSSRVAGRR